MSQTDATGQVVDRERLPANWPTRRCPPEFWEQLGRTVVAMGILEDCPKRALLAITATREYDSLKAAEETFETWERELERSMNETLGALAQRVIGVPTEDKRYSPSDSPGKPVLASLAAK